jgi:hypothetical protein
LLLIVLPTISSSIGTSTGIKPTAARTKNRIDSVVNDHVDLSINIDSFGEELYLIDVALG